MPPRVLHFSAFHYLHCKTQKPLTLHGEIATYIHTYGLDFFLLEHNKSHWGPKHSMGQLTLLLYATHVQWENEKMAELGFKLGTSGSVSLVGLDILPGKGTNIRHTTVIHEYERHLHNKLSIYYIYLKVKEAQSVFQGPGQEN